MRLPDETDQKPIKNPNRFLTLSGEVGAKTILEGRRSGRPDAVEAVEIICTILVPD